jgi:hypothetical protein
MIWQEVEKKYGKTMANKMKKSTWLRGITVEIIKIKGKKEIDYPERDIKLAHRDVLHEKISQTEWD